MKKVILSISAMLFVGAAAFAQNNTSNVDQIGGFQTSAVAQVGMNNDVEVSQGVNPLLDMSSFGNYSNVSQNGMGNYGFVSQNNFLNEAYQNQIGNSNEARIWQDEEIDGFLIVGNDYANQLQIGSENNATIDQGTTGNMWPTNPPFSASQMGQFQGQVDTPVIPHGFNDAYQEQYGDWGIAFASQGGTVNYSSQIQVGNGSFNGNENESYHFQFGTLHTATSYQNGGGLGNSTMQIGAGNNSDVEQWDQGHQSVVFQNGIGIVSTVYQSN